MPKKKKELKEETPKVTPKLKVKKPPFIEVGVPGKIATVDKGVKEVLYRGEVREIMECNTRQRELELQDKDSVTVLDSNGDPQTIYLD